MSQTAASLRHKIASAGDLEAVVRTMKAMAASSIGQYENAVQSLDEYYRTVQLGLAVCLRASGPLLGTPAAQGRKDAAIGAVVFGSDQGLVGQFNEDLLEFVVDHLGRLPGQKVVLAVGERIQARLAEAGLPAGKAFALPSAIGAITPLVGHILIELEARHEKGEIGDVYLFHNSPKAGSLYDQVAQHLLPLDEAWRVELAREPWTTINLPEVLNGIPQTLPAFLREFLFVSLFRGCAQSLASENASRLAAMQRAEKNIAETMETLNRDFHRLRQSSIDEELFDVVAGFEALSGTHGNSGV
tara:strand:- start:49 stop:951 length:903 start_codon:yes stop_codon:yes gene_type:complete